MEWYPKGGTKIIEEGFFQGHRIPIMQISLQSVENSNSFPTQTEDILILDVTVKSL